MRVTVLPNQRRPGIGRAPAREHRRAWLPQQARLCPVLEDASRSGFLVYPPLATSEALQVRCLEEHRFRLGLFVDDEAGASHRVFVIDVTPAAGGGGLDAYDVRFIEPGARLDEDRVLALADALVTNLNAPPGAIGLRGAHDFVTPEGWDTLYLGVVNEVQRPHLPVLAARIETDWYPQATEFRYAMQPGDVLSASGGAPIGQVIFAPREPVELEEADEDATRRFLTAQREYWTERRRKERVTDFGAVQSHHYRDVQRDRRAGQSRTGQPRSDRS